MRKIIRIYEQFDERRNNKMVADIGHCRRDDGTVFINILKIELSVCI